MFHVSSTKTGENLEQGSRVSLRSDLAELLEGTLRNLWGGSVPNDFQVDVSQSDNLDFGDLTCNMAMKLAGILRENPRRIAERVMGSLPGEIRGISNVRVDGPGFINFQLSSEYLASIAFDISDGGLGPLLPDQGKGRSALVEFVSSNPTGPLTVGHCRQAVLGDAISRILEATGWNVSREYYFNDGGRQMMLLGQSLAARYSGEGDRGIPENGYRGEYVKRWARDMKSEMGDTLSWDRNPDLFREYAEKKAMELIVSDLAMLGIEFDRFYAESELIPGKVTNAIQLLSKKTVDGVSLVYEDQEDPRKLWLRFSALSRPQDRVIRREDGSYTYRMPDIAYHVDKFRRGFSLIVDVFGADHLDTSRDVVAALKELLGKEEVDEKLRVVIHQFVTLIKEGNRIKMSTRSGDFITLKDLVEDTGSADVTRYLFLTRRSEAHMDFDLDLARKQSSENPVYYVQYAHARIAGILRTACEQGIELPESISEVLHEALEGEHQRELMRLLESVPSEVSASAESLEPHRITELLAELATGFHRFYQHVRVVDPEEVEASSARLMLCSACKRCIADLLELLGVDAPSSM